ncbi:N-acetylmuramoyl-L-alanine amidase [Desulfitispora alkaliphila]|uniref:N-acetylmuramoyl-L-alanine amidase n=1 Tax=Desulfitispora alkaliphila TaxID=622674 RepID=UPI003D2253BB
MSKVCLDYGHGGTDPGAVYQGRKESDDNLAIGLEVTKELRRHGVEVGETRTRDQTVSLRERSDFSNRGDYDYFISFHRNAFRPEQARGAETFVFTRPSAKSKELADKVQKAMVDVGFVNRRVKNANFHVLRETRCPAILIEIGFLDNTGDNQLFDQKRQELIDGITKAILQQLGVKYQEKASAPSTPAKAPSPTPADEKVFYRVMAGSFANRDNANRQVKRLKDAGFDATIMIFRP